MVDPRSSRLAQSLLAELDRRFAAVADPDLAAPMRAYMRNQFPFLGIKSPDRVAILRDVTTTLPLPDQPDVEAFARSAWDRDPREYQQSGCWYARRHVKRLDASFLDTARYLISHKSWWDTVDDLAQNVVGPIVLAQPETAALMDAWIDDTDLWLSRTALLHQNRFKGLTDPDRLFRHCLARAGDTDFFIRKAIGWALREYSKTDPAAVRAFVSDHTGTLSGLSRREALKWVDRVPREGHDAKGPPGGQPPAGSNR